MIKLTTLEKRFRVIEAWKVALNEYYYVCGDGFVFVRPEDITLIQKTRLKGENGGIDALIVRYKKKIYCQNTKENFDAIMEVVGD